MNIDKYCQILCIGGYIHDISTEVWLLVKEEIRRKNDFIEFEDIYGAECVMPWYIWLSTREWTKESGKRYKELNEDPPDFAEL